MTRPVLLWGPPASGKTTLGRAMAQALGWEFADLDEHLVQAEGRSIAEQFAAHGEAAFRAREAAQLRAWLEAPTSARVIAVGGGALVDPAVRAWALRHADVIGLRAALDALHARAQAQGGRPLLAAGADTGARSDADADAHPDIAAARGRDPASVLAREDEARARLSALLQARAAAYAQAHAHVDAHAQPHEVLSAALAAHARLRAGTTVWAQADAQAYPVRIGALDELAQIVAETAPSGVLWVEDPAVSDRAAAALRQLAGAVRGPIARVVLAGAEVQDKSLDTLAELWDAAVEAGLDRRAVFVAVGGGSTSDVVGFAASTYLRGVRTVLAPSTLLSMADASVGGKTAIDHPRGKNLVGAFHSPSAVLCAPELLVTQSARDLRAGLAEIAKIALACDAALVQRLWDRADALRALDLGALREVIAPAVAVKAAVVAEDPREQTVRALLNFGHTIGHGLELAAQWTVPHGECVAIGMRAEIELGVRLGVTPPAVADDAHRLLDALGLPAQLDAALDPAEVLAGMSTDKKRATTGLRFVLLDALGRAHLHPVAAEHYAPIVTAHAAAPSGRF